MTDATTRTGPEELATLFLFEELSPERLEWLSGLGREARYAQGETIYRERDPGENFYVLLEGTITLTRRVRGGGEIEVTRTDYRGAYFGALLAVVGTQDNPPYTNTAMAVTDVRLFQLPISALTEMVRHWMPMAAHLLRGVFATMRGSQARVAERENLAALGRLTASLAHELNNPSAAAVRASSALRTRYAAMRHLLRDVAMDAPPGAIASLLELQEEAAARAGKPGDPASPLAVSDREDELTDWLEERGVDDAVDLAAILVTAGLDVEWARGVADRVGPDYLPTAMAWLGGVVEAETLLAEITEATGRISELITAAKQYSQMDRAPYQRADLHELLDSTLSIFKHKLPSGVRVRKDYASDLPPMDVYAAELNQVWTNLIDNALYAMDGHGTLTVRTRRDVGWVIVEIGDTGPGIPTEEHARIFEPFYSTKPPDQGTGLGLDITHRIVVNRHRGDLRVESRPGDTRFQVRLPLLDTGSDTTDSPI